MAQQLQQGDQQYQQIQEAPSSRMPIPSNINFQATMQEAPSIARGELINNPDYEEMQQADGYMNKPYAPIAQARSNIAETRTKTRFQNA
jgi:hypothetical protein